MQKIAKLPKCKKIVKKIAIFLKIAKNRSRNFPDGQAGTKSAQINGPYLMSI